MLRLCQYYKISTTSSTALSGRSVEEHSPGLCLDPLDGTCPGWPYNCSRYNQISSRFDIPETIVTNNGTQFCSGEFKKMCEQLRIVHIRTAPYHPQSNGQAERYVNTLKRSLRKIVEGEEVPSVEALQKFLHVYRSTPSCRKITVGRNAGSAHAYNTGSFASVNVQQ